LRTTALLALGGFAVHQARYALVPDAHGAQGHGYLHVVPALLVALASVALARTLVLLVRRAAAPASRSSSARWLAASGALLVLHVLQEGAERVVAGGGPLDRGALLAVPLCLAAGAVIAAALRGADELLEAAVPAPFAPLPRTLPAALGACFPVGTAPVAPRRGMLARHLAGRAPPPALG